MYHVLTCIRLSVGDIEKRKRNYDRKISENEISTRKNTSDFKNSPPEKKIENLARLKQRQIFSEVFDVLLATVIYSKHSHFRNENENENENNYDMDNMNVRKNSENKYNHDENDDYCNRKRLNHRDAYDDRCDNVDRNKKNGYQNCDRINIEENDFENEEICLESNTHQKRNTGINKNCANDTSNKYELPSDLTYILNELENDQNGSKLSPNKFYFPLTENATDGKTTKKMNFDNCSDSIVHEKCSKNGAVDYSDVKEEISNPGVIDKMQLFLDFTDFERDIKILRKFSLDEKEKEKESVNSEIKDSRISEKEIVSNGNYYEITNKDNGHKSNDNDNFDKVFSRPLSYDNPARSETRISSNIGESFQSNKRYFRPKKYFLSSNVGHKVHLIENTVRTFRNSHTDLSEENFEISRKFSEKNETESEEIGRNFPEISKENRMANENRKTFFHDNKNDYNNDNRNDDNDIHTDGDDNIEIDDVVKEHSVNKITSISTINFSPSSFFLNPEIPQGYLDTINAQPGTLQLTRCGSVAFSCLLSGAES